MVAWPFEGREDELLPIRSAFRGSTSDSVLIVGPPGAGKTRLAREALSHLGAARTAWIGATRAATAIPFSAIAPLLPDDVPTGGPLDVLRAVTRNVAGWGGRPQVAITVDDVHLLDDASSTVVARLVAEGLAFLVMTARGGEPVPDVLAGLCKKGHAQHTGLPPLPDAAIDRLIDRAASAPPSGRNRRRLQRLAHGNPLALRELLYGAVPGGLTDLVRSRLERIDAESRFAVELVACGEPVELSIVEELAGLSPLACAEGEGLVVVELTGERLLARLGHPLYGEVLRATMSRSRAARAYRALADALLRTASERTRDVLRAALWQVEGDRISRPDVVRAGAWLAIGHADLDLAERLARAAPATSSAH